jgi:hypothetical protein
MATGGRLISTLPSKARPRMSAEGRFHLTALRAFAQCSMTAMPFGPYFAMRGHFLQFTFGDKLLISLQMLCI